MPWTDIVPSGATLRARGTRWAWIGWLWWTGCNAESGASPVPPNQPGMHSDGGTDGGIADGSMRDGALGDAGGMDGLAPVVALLSPKAVRDLNSPDLLRERTVSVTCQVRPGSEAGAQAVDTDSIAITASGPDAMMGEDGVLDALPDQVYRAEFSVGAWPNGRVTFTCQASDTSAVPKTTVRTLQTYLDQGPTIEVTAPVDGSRHALKAPVTLDFTVAAAPLADGDEGAEVDTVAVSIPGASAALVPIPDSEQPGRYTLAVDFDDRDLFNATPQTAQITLAAQNRRAPTPVTRTTQVNISLDADGPEIDVRSPEDQGIARGEVLIRVELTDPSGVRDDALQLVIPDGEGDLVIDDWHVDGTTFEQQFDTRHFASTRTQLTLNFRARDAVGNQSTAGVTVRLDNLPPLLSLDPPDIREYHITPVGQTFDSWCSDAFDPVGRGAAGDGAAISTASLFRALVWDQTNGASGSLTRWHAGVDEDAVELFYRPADGLPLLVDTTADGHDRCDEIHASHLGTGIAAEDDPRFVPLRPVTPHGTSASLGQDLFWQKDPYDACVDPPRVVQSEAASPPRCTSSEMFRVPPQPLEGKPAGIFAFNPSDTRDMAACDGEALALGEQLSPGWVCLAARAVDLIGNIGVSPPLRVCLTDPQQAEACDGDPPSCTDGCAAPPDLPEGTIIEFQE